jgi:CO/xanthine dehydrogenase Mo-binding subunit
MDGGAPALAAAIEQAIHAECNNLPLLPEDLFRAVNAAKAAGKGSAR